jgi:hypothetical protein
LKLHCGAARQRLPRWRVFCRSPPASRTARQVSNPMLQPIFVVYSRFRTINRHQLCLEAEAWLKAEIFSTFLDRGKLSPLRFMSTSSEHETNRALRLHSAIHHHLAVPASYARRWLSLYRLPLAKLLDAVPHLLPSTCLHPSNPKTCLGNTSVRDLFPSTPSQHSNEQVQQ